MMNPLERLWKDRMDIYRWVDRVENNITKSSEELVHSNIKCHYSKKGLSDVVIEGSPSVVNSYALYCSLETDLKEGDVVVVTLADGRRIKLSVGEGFPYSRHMEFSVKRDGTI